MPASYPGSVYAGQVIPALRSDTPTNSQILGRFSEEIVATQQELGANVSGAYATVAARIAALDAATSTTLSTTGFGGSLILTKVGSLVVANFAMNRSGATIAAATDLTLATVPAGYLPSASHHAVLQASSPDGSFRVTIAAGTGTMTLHQIVINTGAALVGNASWFV